MQAEQSVDESHGSLTVHELLTQSQSEQDPELGPDELPVMQVHESAHQPQLARVVQSVQLEDELHGSPVEQELETQAQSEQ